MSWNSKLGQNDLRAAWREFCEWLANLAELLLEGCEQIADWLFGMSWRKGMLRWLLITLVGAGTWAILAYGSRDKASFTIDGGLAFAQVKYVACTVRSAVTSNPQKYARDNRCYTHKVARSFTFDPLVYEIPFKVLFDPAVFRHVLLAGFAVWMAFKIAALYQSRIYELPNTSMAEHFILQASLINPYNLLNIQGGKVANRDQHSPTFWIGGPGKVCVHLENAALFEKMNGESHVVGPTVKHKSQVVQLEGFERLRKIIDLRDQKESFNISGRSQDGIRISAKDVQVVYSVYRDYQEPTYDRPYPFQDPAAITNLAYQQGTGAWNVAIANQIRGGLNDFFSEHTLNDFLAMIEKPEWEKKQLQEMELIKEGNRLLGLSQPVNPPPLGGAPGIEFVPRPLITDRFYTRAEEIRRTRGVQINWIGVGTWDFPDQVFFSRHQDAWRITRTNLSLSQSVTLGGLRKERRLGETLRLIQSVPIKTYRTHSTTNKPPDDILLALVIAYFQQIRAAYEDYQRVIKEIDQEEANEQDPVKRIELQEERIRLNEEKEKLRESLLYLTRFTGRWLGGP